VINITVSKKIIFPVLTVTMLGGMVTIGANRAAAQTSGSPFSGLVEMIATKFGLDKNQVQSVFDQYQAQRRQTIDQDRLQRQKDRLDKLVQDGKITETQKEAILSKLADLKTKYTSDSFRNLTPAEKMQQINAEREEIKSWATAQGIDPAYIMPGFGWYGEGMRHGWKWTAITPTPTPQ
jgi:hypothetical protein